MATTAERRLQPKEIRRFGSLRPPYLIPDLTEIQTRSYEAFLQYDVPAAKRNDQGIEGVLREIFPSRATTRRSAWNTFATSWASRATSPTSAASCG